MDKLDDFASQLGLELADALSRAEEILVKPAPNSEIEPPRILVGLSGGSDSTALLLALHEVADRYGWRISACHVNHGLRGTESERDEQFCKQLCESLGCELFLKHMSRRGEQELQQALVPEAELRMHRYEMLAQVAREIDGHFVAVAHTKDDQSETMLFRLFRGTSVFGLTGMKSVRKISGDVTLLRPMLKVSRKRCLEYLQRRGVSHCEDSSNLDLRYARNFIRHEVVSLIEQRFPCFMNRMEQLRQVISDESDFLERLAETELLALDRPSEVGRVANFAAQSSNDRRWRHTDFARLHTALARRVIALSMRRKEIEVSFERVGEILSMIEAGAPNAVSLNSTWDFRVDASGDALWQDKTTLPDVSFDDVAVKIPGVTIVAALGLILHVEALPPDLSESSSELLFPVSTAMTALVDISRLELPLVVRNQLPGDLIQPFGMVEHVKLKKYLRTRGNGRASSAKLFIADQGEIVWIPGVGLSERLRASGRPTHRFTLTSISDQIALA